MDPFVIDIPKVFRWILVNLLIVPKRSHDSSKLYQKVWTEEGSPLLVHLQNLEKKLKVKLSDRYEVVGAMRYGKPAIQKAIELLKGKGITDILVLPLYPQYSLAATESSIQKVREETAHWFPEAQLRFIRDFYDQEDYLNASAEVIQKYLKNISWDLILFSFHGLPERQVKKTDPSQTHCLKVKNCCKKIVEANKNCYRAQSYATARALAKKLGIGEQQYRVGFQSRLKGAPWIQPFSDEFYRELPKQGVKKLVVISPSFVADCLETLEEVQMRGKEEFVQHGGEELTLIPSLNSEEAWVNGLAQLIENYQPSR